MNGRLKPVYHSGTSHADGSQQPILSIEQGHGVAFVIHGSVNQDVAGVVSTVADDRHLGAVDVAAVGRNEKLIGTCGGLRGPLEVLKG